MSTAKQDKKSAPTPRKTLRVVQCITQGPLRSARAFLEFIQNSEGVAENELVQCVRAYPVPPSYTDGCLLGLIRSTRMDLKHYGLKTK